MYIIESKLLQITSKLILNPNVSIYLFNHVRNICLFHLIQLRIKILDFFSEILLIYRNIQQISVIYRLGSKSLAKKFVELSKIARPEANI